MNHSTNTRTVSVLTVSALLSALLMPCQANAETDEPSITVLSRCLNQYVGQQGAVWHKKSAMQSELDILWPANTDGISPYINIWHSFGLNDSSLSSDDADEIDSTAGLKTQANVFGTDLTVNAGITHFDTVDLLKTTKCDIYNPFLELSKEFEVSAGNTITPYLKLSHFLPVTGSSPEKGLYVFGGVRQAWQIAPDLAISQKLGLIHDGGALGLDSGFIGEYWFGLDWELSEYLTWNVIYLKIYSPLTAHDRRETEAVIGGGFIYKPRYDNHFMKRKY